MELNWKTIEIKSIYTRKIDREFNEILFAGTKANTSNPNWIDVELVNIQKANDYVIKAMTNLTEQEIDELSASDYNKILEEVNKIKNGSN